MKCNSCCDIEVIAVLTHKFVYGASISYRYVAIRI
jgi:hypothetical protein